MNKYVTENPNWRKEDPADVLLKFLSFLISPLLGLLVSIARINTKSSFVIFFLFSVFFGLCFTTVSGRDENNKGDAAQYRMRFEMNSGMDQHDLRDIITEYQTFENERNRDIYVPIMTFLALTISDSYHVFFALLAVVFAFFMLKTFHFFTKEFPGRINVYILILIYLFVLTNSIFNINGCRFWTAAWIAVYCVFKIYLTGDKRYYLLALITPLVHASYWFFLAVLLVAYLFGKGIRFWKFFFFASFILSSISIQLVADFSAYLPPTLQFLVERYTSGDGEIQTNLYQVLKRIFDFANLLVLAIMMYLLMKHEEVVFNNSKTHGLYPFLLVWMALCSFVMPIPSLGNRFIVLGLPILAYVWYLVFENQSQYRLLLLLYVITSMMNIYELICCYTLFSVPLSFYYTSPLFQIYNYLILGII